MNEKTSRLSVGLAVYNGEKFLEEAIESILQQTFTDFELIISDNASTDKTEGICRKLAKQDKRIRYYRSDTNRGASWNFNRVVDLARGELFKWMADDDLYAPTFFEKCIEALDNDSDVVLAYPRSDTIDEKGEFIKSRNYEMNVGSDKPWERFRHQIIDPHGCLHVFGVVRADIFKKTPRLANYVGSDRVLLGLLSLYGKFYEVSDHLFYHREHQRRSVRAYSDIRMRAVWFDPKKKGKRSYPYWKYLLEHTRSVFRAPLTFGARLMSLLQVIKWIRWNFGELVKDLTYKPPKAKKESRESDKQSSRSISHN
jgi:glycosyltransferase involved in cell wall biosynthesis